MTRKELLRETPQPVVTTEHGLGAPCWLLLALGLAQRATQTSGLNLLWRAPTLGNAHLDELWLAIWAWLRLACTPEACGRFWF